MSENLLPRHASIRSAIASINNPVNFLAQSIVIDPDIIMSHKSRDAAFIVHNPEFVRHILQKNSKNYVKSERYRILSFLTEAGLISSEGEHWLKNRRVVQASFSNASLQSLANEMLSSIDKYFDKWKIEEPRQINVDISFLTFELLAKAILGTGEEDHFDKLYNHINRFDKIASYLIKIPFSFPTWLLNSPLFADLKNSIRAIQEIISSIIQKRRQNIGSYDDILNSFMNATYADGEKLSDQQVRDEVITLLTGYLTTERTLWWLTYLLGCHPGVQAEIYREAAEVLSSHETAYEKSKKLVYTTKVINETMRLYPVAYIIGRKALEDDQVGSYVLSAGKDVFVNVYGLHRHPSYWKLPNMFIPSRFDNPDHSKNNFYFLPFGAGGRFCVGANLAMLEMKLILSILMNKFRLYLLDRRPLKALPQITLKPARDVLVRLENRGGNFC